MNKDSKSIDKSVDRIVKEYTLDILNEVSELMGSDVFSTGDYKRDSRLLEKTNLILEWLNIENKEGK